MTLTDLEWSFHALCAISAVAELPVSLEGLQSFMQWRRYFASHLSPISYVVNETHCYTVASLLEILKVKSSLISTPDDLFRISHLRILFSLIKPALSITLPCRQQRDDYACCRRGFSLSFPANDAALKSTEINGLRWRGRRLSAIIPYRP